MSKNDLVPAMLAPRELHTSDGRIWFEYSAYQEMKESRDFNAKMADALLEQNKIMREALENISKNSCCGSCQEAKLVALRALASTEPISRMDPVDLGKQLCELASSGTTKYDSESK